MVEILGLETDTATCPQQECGIHRSIVKFEPAGQQGRAHVPAQPVIAAHHGSVRPVHRAQYPGMLLEMTLGRREFMRFHQMLLYAENLFDPIKQTPIACADFMVAAMA